MKYIKGKFRRSIYESGRGYVVGLFKVEDVSCEEFLDMIDKTITFTGYFHELNDRDSYIMYGDLGEHEKYGKQFMVSSYERVEPKGKDAIYEFLTSGLFKGIGKTKAKLITDKLGDNTLNVILENKDLLYLIPTITEKNIDTLYNTLKEYENSYKTIIYLGELGFSSNESMKIYNKYKDRTRNVIDEDIYNIYYDKLDISYKHIDTIALSLEYRLEDIRRVSSSILYIMNELTNVYGHEYFFRDDIYNYLERVIGSFISNDLFLMGLDRLEKNLYIKCEDDKYFLIDMYSMINIITKRFRMLSHQEDDNIKNIDKYIDLIEEKFGIKYDSSQKDAIKSSICKHISIITGGPGTGKTTILKGIIELYKTINKYSYIDLENRIALLSPTGRASKRMSEATNVLASTIHRFLKWQKDTSKFQVNRYNKSKVELVIIDEVSMVDTYLLGSLIDGINANCKIILVGDDHQLPSVGAGEVLRDLIDSSVIYTTKLTKLYRQEEGSNILKLSYDMRSGIINRDIFNKSSDLEFISVSSNNISSVVQDLAKSYDMSSKMVQILAPQYKGICGIDIINKKVQDIVNPKDKSKKEIKIGDDIIRVGDKVLQLTNQPDDNIYNGDIGIVDDIVLSPKKEVYISYDDNIVKYTPSSFSNFRLAYAISIHKSQGSEFDLAIVLVSTMYRKMLYRRLYYTGVTRAKKKLIIVGEEVALDVATRTEKDNDRRTIIKDKMNKK